MQLNICLSILSNVDENCSVSHLAYVFYQTQNSQYDWLLRSIDARIISTTTTTHAPRDHWLLRPLSNCQFAESIIINSNADSLIHTHTPRASSTRIIIKGSVWLCGWLLVVQCFSICRWLSTVLTGFIIWLIHNSWIDDEWEEEGKCLMLHQVHSRIGCDLIIFSDIIRFVDMTGSTNSWLENMYSRRWPRSTNTHS